MADIERMRTQLLVENRNLRTHPRVTIQIQVNISILTSAAMTMRMQTKSIA